MKLRSKFSLGLTCLISLTALSIGGITVWSDRKTLEDELHQRHRQLVQQLARVCEESLFQGNLVFFNFSQTLKTERGFRAASFVDLNGKTPFHSDPAQTGRSYVEPDPGFLHYKEAVYFKDSLVGESHLLISKADVRAFLNESLRKNIHRIGLITLVVLVFSVLLGLLLARAMLVPIQHVVEAMKKVSDGHREAIAFPKRRDELGWMGEELNRTIGRLKEVDEMKRDFVAGVTHELKSPLEAIDGFVNIMRSGPETVKPDMRNEFLTSILNNTKRLRTLIENLLLTARLEAHREEFIARQFDICAVVNEAARSFVGMSKEKVLPIHTHFSKPKISAWADPDKVMDVLINLISNAFKYTPKGSIEVRVLDEKDHVKVSVVDTGYGIPAEDHKRVFEKFFRSKSNAKKAKGTELGLSIAKGLIEQQGGIIWVEANPTGGSNFSFTLPR